MAWTELPGTRPADSYISYSDSSVLIDFSHKSDIVRLLRISFDWYGCCELSQDRVIPLNTIDSANYLDMFRSWNMDQDRMLDIIKKTIEDNHLNIWNDALTEYNLIPKN